MSYVLVDRVFEIKGLDPTDSWVLAAICRHADDKGRSFPGVAMLCQETRFKDRTVRDSIKHLELHGFHVVEHRPGMSNVYILSLDNGVSCSTRTKCLRTPAPRAVLHHVQSPLVVQDTPAPRADPPLHHVPPNQSYESVNEPVNLNQSETPAPRAGLRKPPRKHRDSSSVRPEGASNNRQQGPAPRAGVRKNRDCTGDCTACPVSPCPYYTDGGTEAVKQDGPVNEREGDSKRRRAPRGTSGTPHDKERAPEGSSQTIQEATRADSQ